MNIVRWVHLERHRFGLWFRVFGYGLSIMDRSRVKAPFSVRNGHRKEIRIGRFGVKLLKPN